MHGLTPDEELQYWRDQARHWQAKAEQAETSHIAIVTAARAWRVGRDRDVVGTAPSGGARSATGVALIDALDGAKFVDDLIEEREAWSMFMRRQCEELREQLATARHDLANLRQVEADLRERVVQHERVVEAAKEQRRLSGLLDEESERKPIDQEQYASAFDAWVKSTDATERAIDALDGGGKP